MGRLVSAREGQFRKAAGPMMVRPSGRLVSARERQLTKAYGKVVTDAGEAIG